MGDGRSGYGIQEPIWRKAKAGVRAALVARAKLRGTIPYSELTSQCSTVPFEPHDFRLFHLLGEISTEEDEAGRGMLSVVVVHKDGDMQPGPGFFQLAEELGRDTSDILSCRITELRKVHRYWSVLSTP